MAQQAKYLEIADAILARIRHLPPGSRCPGVNQVTREFQVARATTERVLKHLAEQGHVRQVTGKGTFVAELRSRKVAVLAAAAPGQFIHADSDLDPCNTLARRIGDHLRQAGYLVRIFPPVAGCAPEPSDLASYEPDLIVTIRTPWPAPETFP